MNNNRTELVFILDRSGSMAGLESDTIGGYNSMLTKQKEIAGEALVTTVLFDSDYELLHDRADIRGISPITSTEYFVRGTTALLDAIGKTIKKIENAAKNISPQYQPAQTVFVIITDGMENSSKRYSVEYVKEKVQEKTKSGWEFIFLGANIDAIATAQQYGIDASRAANYHADSEGTQLNYETISNAIKTIRSHKTLSEDWKSEIDSDFKQRGKH